VAYLIDDHEGDTPPVQRRPPRKIQPRKAAKMAQPDLPLVKAAPPLAKAVEPDLSKAMLLDQLDDERPLALMIKSAQVDSAFRAKLRGVWDQPSPLEQRVSEQETMIGKVLGVLEAQSHLRHKNGNSVHLTPPLPQPRPASSARHYSPDDQLADQLNKAAAADSDDLTKAIAADPHYVARVATLKGVVGISEEMERARVAALQARMATLRGDIDRALMIGRTVPQPNDHKDNESANAHN
jgi:hypothetical protein